MVTLPLARSYPQGLFSQGEEDHVLAALTDQTYSTHPRRFVEIGVGPGVENNTRALAYRGWRGWWFGDEPLLIDLPPGVLSFTQATVTPANVVDLLTGAGVVPGSVDVFSLDIDGNDWWVGGVAIPWLRPTIVVVEYWRDAPTASWVMPYTPGYRWHAGEPCGAALQMWQLLLMDNYDLVYTTRDQINAFFVRRSSADATRGADMNDTLQSIITDLQQLQLDLAKNEGRPSVHELQNRLGRLVIQAQMLQQNALQATRQQAPTSPLPPALVSPPPDVVVPAPVLSSPAVEGDIADGPTAGDEQSRTQTDV